MFALSALRKTHHALRRIALTGQSVEIVKTGSTHCVTMLKTSQAASVVCVAHQQRRSRVLVSAKQIFTLFILEVPEIPVIDDHSIFPSPPLVVII